MKANKFDDIMTRVREMGENEYPTPFNSRRYEFPPAYPAASKVKCGILDPLGVFLFGIECWRNGGAEASELESMTAAFMTRHKAWKWDHPLYLVTGDLAGMLVQTDRLDEPNIDLDSKPPFPAGHLVLPKHLIGTPDGAHVVTLSWAVLDYADFENTPVRCPDNLKGGRRFYLAIDMSNGVGYFAKLEVSDTGVVENPEDSPYSEDMMIYTHGKEMHDYLSNTPAKNPGDSIGVVPRFTAADGPAILSITVNLVLGLFTFLNMDREQDTVEVARMTGSARARKDKPAREFWKPAIIGLNMHPSGRATQGSHASPHCHIRRGHWRWQHYGEGNAQKKRLWIKPVIVMGRSN